ncbi:MAG: uroporphyrinogen decarboxylase family protein [Armatimonadota bacterium]
MTSRERMLAALSCEEPDHVPACFMIFAALREQCDDEWQFVDRQLAMGLDAVVRAPLTPLKAETDYGDLRGLPPRPAGEVEMQTCREVVPGERRPLLHKEYRTPAGTLTTVVNETEDWPYGEHVPLFDDFICPRARKFPVTGPDDLPALRYVLEPPSAEDIDALHRQVRQARQFADQRGILVEGGWGVGGDALGWLCGFENAMMMAADQPEFIQDLLDLIATWNRRRMEVALDAGVDLFVRRGWYEGVDFFSPAMFRRFLLPALKAEVDLAHQAGAKFGYIITTGMMPILDALLEAGIDTIIGVDPVQGRGTDLALVKQNLGGSICLWGGVNGFLTIERGTEDDVRAATREAIETLAPGGGFILSPVDNVSADSDTTWRNVAALIDCWKQLRA